MAEAAFLANYKKSLLFLNIKELQPNLKGHAPQEKNIVNLNGDGQTVHKN